LAHDVARAARPAEPRFISAFRENCQYENAEIAISLGVLSARDKTADKADAKCAMSVPMPSEEEMKAEIERLRSENERLKKPSRGAMSLKVSEKGGLSVYGLGRFPVTLYREQWEKLLAMADQIREFIQENDAALKKKE
jgi:hypothetical protein